MLIKISQHFGISVDDLVKNEMQLTTNNKSKTNSRLWLIALPIFVLICVIAVGIWNKHNSQSVNFSMKDDKTYKSNDAAQTSLTVAKGYFTVPKAGKLEVKVNATTDNGNFHLTIVDNNHHHYYQIDGDDLKDSQKLYFKSGDLLYSHYSRCLYRKKLLVWITILKLIVSDLFEKAHEIFHCFIYS
ncbi:hypothetical protein QK903_00510 [Streptococcus thermophilus]|uniref:hypothetical protein n=2 Tax=Streptococcus thermophilus TaxID=1308 RepID=UPI003A80C169